MKITKCLLTALVLGLSTSAFAGSQLFKTGFEAADADGSYSPGSLDGQPMGSQVQWQVTAPQGLDAEVVNDPSFAQSGEQFVRLEAGVTVDRTFDDRPEVGAANDVWVEGFFRGTGTSVALKDAVYPDIAASAVVHFHDQNGIQFLNGDKSGGAIGSNGVTAVNTGVPLQGDQWYRVTLRLNFATQEWDAFVDGSKVNTTPMGFRDNVTRLSGYRDLSQSESFLDQFRIVQPILGDSNGDGLVDAGDAIEIQQSAASPPDDPILFADSDVNNDGNITVDGDVPELVARFLNP